MQSYSELIRNLSCEYDLYYLDIYSLIGDSISSYSCDNVHYNAAGHTLVGDLMFDAIKFPDKYLASKTTIKVDINAKSQAVAWNVSYNGAVVDGSNTINLDSVLSSYRCET